MKIRKYRDADCGKVSQLFYETVRFVNAKDYTAEQLTAWANNSDALKARRNDLLNQYTLIAEIGGEIAGFGSIDKYGLLDFLFVSKDFQKQGVGTALCNELEKGFTEVKTFASITARPFFEKRGYIIIKEREAERAGVKLKNYEMLKKIQPEILSD